MSIQVSIATPTADSYISVASANTYFLSRENADKWYNMGSTGTVTTTGRKEGLLKQATRELDNFLRFSYNKYYTYPVGDANYQNLEFPRSVNTDADGDLYIPAEVKDDTCEQALWIMERGGLKTNTISGYEFASQRIGREAYNFIKRWVTRQIKGTGNFSWQKSSY